MALRREVLRKYREALSLCRSWRAADDAETAAERAYIREEARKLFRKNKDLVDQSEIRICLQEATTRLEMAHHYQNPYPRPVNFPPGYVAASRSMKAQLRRTKEAEPVHIHSQDK